MGIVLNQKRTIAALLGAVAGIALVWFAYRQAGELWERTYRQAEEEGLYE